MNDFTATLVLEMMLLLSAKTSFARKGSSQSNKNKHPPLDGESETYAILAKKNELDILLYFFAKELFDEQKKLIT